MNKEALTQWKALNLASMRYMPQSVQARVHQAQTSIVVINGGEGSGKSVTTAAEIAARYGLWELVHLVCYKYDSATNEGDYLAEYLGRIGQLRSYARPKQGKLQLITNSGGLVESISTEKEGERAVTGTGKSPDIIAMIEAGKQTYEVFQACLVRITRKGGLLILSGTVEQSEAWYPELIDEIKGDNRLGATLVTIPSWENRTLYPGGRDDPKIKLLENNLSEDKFLERIAGETVPQSGLVLKEFNTLRHVSNDVQYDPIAGSVEVWIDPGYSGSHYAVEFVQKVPRWRTIQMLPEFNLPNVSLTDVLVLDEIYADHATSYEVIELAKQNPLWDYVVGGVGDVAIKQHAAMPSHFEVWQSHAHLLLRSQFVEIDKNIERHRTFLKDPHGGGARLFYHPQCHGAIKEYKRWKRKEMGDDLFGAPESGNCDALKAIGYGLIDHFGIVEPAPKSAMDKINRALNLDAQLHEAFG